MSEPKVPYHVGGPEGKLMLRCVHCGHELERVTRVGSKTALERDGLVIYRARLTCPVCGGETDFHSDPISAVRLGLTGVTSVLG